MLQQDFNEFAVLWTTVKNMYPLKNPVTDKEVCIVFGLLQPYSLNEVKCGLTKFMREFNHAPTPHDVISAIGEIKHEDHTSLELQASKWYMELSKGFSIGQDIITDDARAVIAFKNCFGSVNGFREVNAKTDAFRRKDFIQAYLLVSDADLKANEITNHWIQGIYRTAFNPLVRFIGDIEKCKKIAKIVYANKRPRYTTLNDLAEIEFKRSQNEKLALSGTDVPQNDENASKELYVQKAEMERFFQEFFDALGVKH